MKTSSFFLSLAVIAAASLSTFAQQFADDDASVPQGTKKLMLKISSVETAGTRHQKTWTPPAKPLELSPDQKQYTEAEILQVTPEEAARMRLKNEAAADALRIANAKIAYENWKAADQHMKGVHAQLEGNAYGRQIILALDKFAGEAATYFDPDCIEFFHRADVEEGLQEQERGGNSSIDVIAAPYFIKLIFDDPREQTKIDQIGATTQIKTTTYMQTVTYEVQDNCGKIVAAGNVKQEKRVRTSNAIQTGGTSGNEIVEVLEEALAEVAKRINDRFVAKVSFTLTCKKDKDFDADEGNISVDGEDHDSGEEFSILKGTHEVKVEMDGYAPAKKKSRYNISKSGDIRIPMKKVVTMEEDDDDDEE